LNADQLVDGCLDLLGPLEVASETHDELTSQAKQWGDLRWDNDASVQSSTKRAGEMLQLIVATREFQFA